ncbi:P-loop containing nucleoside triphosphate hydrolase protein [Corynascus novoguineensis]|uniref:P-loop containing nucleoside triphosphate hydrolase protein n=1 Tax=Corynascus novoguineensis TaxID=1126955 RepID=A0AAN7HNM2_9PEZI|nr:P-loop containing nucleoside triphosphate hydrolase protein [Corynascus novoguineensis]
MPFPTGEENLLYVQFEQLLFSIVPSALFIAISFWRTLHQVRKPTVVDAPVLQRIKLVATSTYVGLELSLLVLVARGSLHATNIFVASSALKLVAALSMTALSVLDHIKSPRPSVLLSIYLSLTLLLDAAQARTLFLSSDGKPELVYSGIFSATVAVKAGILLLEALHKSKWVRWDAKKHSPEETSGIFSLGVFFWLNRMFLTGYKKILTLEDLYPLDSSFDAKSLHEKFSAHMDYSRLKGDRFGLAKVLVRTIKVPLLLPVAPRLALIGFKFCQPLFLERLLEYLSQPELLDANIGYGLIGASILTYGGIAISSSLSWYFHHRARTMVRTILVTETFIQATKARFGVRDDSAALTLMSTDVERIKAGFHSLHEVWAGLIQASFATWMLYNRLGLAFLAPLGTVTVCFLGVGIPIHFIGDSQRAWMAGVQKRVGLTATVIGNMKNLKISGLTATISEFVQNLRVEELAAGAHFRAVSIIAAVFGFSALLFSPPLTFAVAQRELNASSTFQAVPQLVSALACLGRIQTFLECETRHDFRRVLSEVKEAENTQGTELSSEHPIILENGHFGWEKEKVVLQYEIGSGKSTFCKALLGETPVSKGNVALSTRFSRIGFCDQTPFLFNGSIRDNIVGFSPFDSGRYAEVLDVTSLRYDLTTLPDGDQTKVGSGGVSLSGGQKQRVSLVQALYVQSDLLVLDDIFSGLDADTEEQVFWDVFGPGGLLRRRRSTVVLCTHSIKHLAAIDHIIALEDSTIVEQGSFSQLMAKDQGECIIRGGTGVSQLLPSVIEGTTALTLRTCESRQVGDRTAYEEYVKSMGWHLAACSLLFASFWGFLTNFSTVWLTYWTDDFSSQYPAKSYGYYVGIYAMLQVSAMISLLLLGITLDITSVKRAGARLHQDALRTLLRAPLSFFSKTDTGVVTNLFSQDLNLIDIELPDATLNTLFCVFQAIGQAAVMLTASLYLAISYPILGILLYVVQRFYLRTSRQLKLLDLETKSPLYTHFLDTHKGITTLRAFGFLSDDIRKNARLIDSSQRPAYLLMMIQEWLNLVLDMVVMVIAALLTTLAVRLHSSSGFTGASLYTLVSFSENLSGIVIFYTRLETSLGAITRLNTFNKTVKPEDNEDEDIDPPEEWPRSGEIEINGISATYHNRTDNSHPNPTTLALRNINLTISSGEKIAICGRTGSGKSSLIALLLKLLDPVLFTNTTPTTIEDSGILIDHTPLRRIRQQTLRERMIAVPQEAVFLPDGCSFRANLDPPSGIEKDDVSGDSGGAGRGKCTAAEYQAALEAVGLWELVLERGGLEAGLAVDMLSAGQRQLLSLARAVLRRRVRGEEGGGEEGEGEGGVLLLDEVSSSLDRETERAMQEVIRAEFRNYTVLAVSHRLDMIMDFDRVVVMDRGKIVEVGTPAVLAAQDGIRFGNLVRASSG